MDIQLIAGRNLLNNCQNFLDNYGADGLRGSSGVVVLAIATYLAFRAIDGGSTLVKTVSFDIAKALDISVSTVTRNRGWSMHTKRVVRGGSYFDKVRRVSVVNPQSEYELLIPARPPNVPGTPDLTNPLHNPVNWKTDEKGKKKTNRLTHWRLYVALTGRKATISGLSRELGLSRPTVRNCLNDMLERAEVLRDGDLYTANLEGPSYPKVEAS